MATMQGVRLPGNSTVEHVTAEVPEPGPGQVLLRMRASSICGSDIRAIYREHLGHGAEAYQGVIAGHEPCGEVVDVGPGARRLGVGDRVVVYHIAGCGMCDECRRGYAVGCHSSFRAAHGWQRDGGHADYLLAEEASCLLLPEPLTFVDGALVSCGFGTAYEGLLRAEVSGRDRLLVTGLGPVGLATAMLGRAMGATTVIGLDPSVERVRLAEQLGLVDVGVSDPDALADAVTESTGGLGCEVAIDCSGNAAARETALRHTRAWGRCVFVGRGRHGHVRRLGPADPQADPPPRIVGDVPAAHGAAARAPRAVGAAPGGDRDPPLPLADADEAYRVADAGESGKVCIVWED